MPPTILVSLRGIIPSEILKLRPGEAIRKEPTVARIDAVLAAEDLRPFRPRLLCRRMMWGETGDQAC